MTSESSGNASVAWLWLCAGLFMVADVVLITQPFFLYEGRQLIALSIPLAQVSLIAIWSVLSQSSLYLRFGVPFVTLIVCWLVLTCILPWGIGEPASAAWGLELVIQLLVIVAAVTVFAVRSVGRKRLRISMQGMIMWTTFVALAFGFIQYGRAKWQWGEEVTRWEFLNAIPLIAVFHAVVALLVLWVVAEKHSALVRAVRAITAIALITGSAFLVAIAADWLTGGPPIRGKETLILALGQMLLIAITLYAGRTWINHSLSTPAAEPL